MAEHNEEFLAAYLPSGRLSLAINIGAHEGEWCQRLSPHFEKVIAIEACEESANVLRQFQQQKFPNVEILDAAGWITSGDLIDFNIRGGDRMGCAIASRDIQRDHAVLERRRIPTIAIDDIPKEACDMIVCDVEGAELMVMQGATRTIENFHPELIIECHEVENRVWLEHWLLRAGYNVAIVHEPHREMHDEWGRHVFLVAQYYRFRGSW